MSAARRRKKKFNRENPIFAAELLDQIERPIPPEPTPGDGFVKLVEYRCAKYHRDMAAYFFRQFFGSVPA